ncbi:ATP-binding protein [Roseimaritima ulvae]|uniref:histidine kinase n=1 Tax=Roseimaritima ulvae TaxID=980254 RepID=A0A5B9QKM7_9BACT|nr:ATP-binding protein [Roseimaritima ulvae]QEG39628.1 Sensor protein RstB [Roseimaritima ulvae]
MTRLFIRFYLGIIAVLIVAWLIQVYVFQGTTEAKNVAVIEEALSGGALSARDDIIAGGEENFAQSIAEVQSRFAYPVNVVDRSDRQISAKAIARMDQGEAVLYSGKMLVAIPDSPWLVELGPLPQFAGPTQRDVLVGLGSVLLLAAGAIAILLRPIARQFRTVEKTALAIAGGDLAARIVEKPRRSLPIVSAFNKMADRVETLLRSQKELLQAVSHELRTPLARIKFATELLRSADNEEKRQQRIDGIDEATDKLDDLVGELLSYMRLGEDAHMAPTRSVSVEDVVSEAIELYAPLNGEIQFGFAAPSPEILLTTYRNDLLRAIGNVVGNAAKYAKSQVQIAVAEQDGYVTITVDDDGIGIPAEDREAVFEPFKRLTKEKQPGAGLGLAIVRRICQRLNGEVVVATSPLGGARFEIRLPANEVA